MGASPATGPAATGSVWPQFLSQLSWSSREAEAESPESGAGRNLPMRAKRAEFEF